MTEYITEKCNKREQETGAVLLDVSNAFDRIWHKGLLIKMLDAGFSKLIRYFLSLETGVPQGAVLSPFYFLELSEPE